jgi:hypothetical protein
LFNHADTKSAGVLRFASELRLPDGGRFQMLDREQQII